MIRTCQIAGNPTGSVTQPAVHATHPLLACPRRVPWPYNKENEEGPRMLTVAALIWMLVIGAIAGWLAGLVMKGRGFGIAGNIVVGIVGAVLGGFLFGALGIVFWGLLGTLLEAFLGAVILLFIIGLIKRA